MKKPRPRYGLVGGLSVACLAVNCHRHHWQVFVFCNREQSSFKYFSGLAAAAQTSRVLITLFSSDRSIFFSLALFSKVGVMSVQLLRFSFPFQFHVLVDTDTYKASILIWRISLSFQTCSERQIGMFYPHLKYFPTLMEIHFVDDLANTESNTFIIHDPWQ